MGDYEERIAKINDTFLGYEDHGILTCYVDLHYGGGAYQGTPGMFLDLPPLVQSPPSPRRPSITCGAFIAGILSACGVRSWSDVKGRTVIALINTTNTMVAGLKPLPTEPGSTFIFADITALGEDEQT